jgi:hypothetical protein
MIDLVCVGTTPAPATLPFRFERKIRRATSDDFKLDPGAIKPPFMRSTKVPRVPAPHEDLVGSLGMNLLLSHL